MKPLCFFSDSIRVLVTVCAALIIVICSFMSAEDMMFFAEPFLCPISNVPAELEPVGQSSTRNRIVMSDPDALSANTAIYGDRVILYAGRSDYQTFLGWFRDTDLPPTGTRIAVPPPSSATLTFYMTSQCIHYVAAWGSDCGIVGGFNQEILSSPAFADDNMRLVTYTVSQVGNIAMDAYNFRINFSASENLRLHFGRISAFEGGEYITYSLLYRTPEALEYSVFAQEIPASLDFVFLNTTGEVWTDISLYFEHVPGGFAQDVYISYTFEVLGDYYTHTNSSSWALATSDRVAWINRLNAKIIDLQNLIPHVQSPETIVMLDGVLSESVMVHDNPRSTNAQILNAIDILDNEIANISAQHPQNPAEAPWTIPLATLLSGISLIVSLFLLLILKRKKEKEHVRRQKLYEQNVFASA